jgi:endonuclease/exonuclease/phosphatase family metal-dependent hydrolase
MKLVTWNTQWCCGVDGVVDPQRIVQHARALADFDVLCLQEIAVNYPRLKGNAGRDQPAHLAKLLPGFQLFFGPAVDEFDPGGQRRQFGNLVATRLPVAWVQHHPLPSPPDPAHQSMPRMCTVVTVRHPRLGPVRIMTTHLEYYSKQQRMAQARALRELHAACCEQAQAPPKPVNDGSPNEPKEHTVQAVLCGDFNLQAQDAEYAAITRSGPHGLRDAWRVLHPGLAHPKTFRVYDRRGRNPIACDFVFVSEGLAAKLRSFAVDAKTKASDHQPVFVEIG